MRSSKFPWGFPWIMGKRRSKLRQANRLGKRAIQTCAMAFDHGIPYLLEFPEDLGSSRGHLPASIWQLSVVKSLAHHSKAHRIALYQKWFGTEYLKPTALLTTMALTKDFTLTGWPRFDGDGFYQGPLVYEEAPPMAMGPTNTVHTAAYPPALNKALARMIVSSIFKNRFSSTQPYPEGGFR